MGKEGKEGKEGKGRAWMKEKVMEGMRSTLIRITEEGVTSGVGSVAMDHLVSSLLVVLLE